MFSDQREIIPSYKLKLKQWQNVLLDQYIEIELTTALKTKVLYK